MSRPRVPLFIVCANPACEKVREVRKRGDQKKQRHCSRRCALLMRPTLTRDGMRRGGLERARRSRLARLARLPASPLDAFRLGYIRGWQSAKRQIVQKFSLTRREVHP